MKSLNFINNQPLAVKLTTACLATSIFSLIIAMVALNIYDKNTYKSLIRDEISLLASVISNRSVESVLFNDKQSALNNLIPLSYRSSIIGACIYRVSSDPKHSTSTLASYPNDKIFCPSAQPGEIKTIEPSHGRFIDFIHPISHEEEIIGYLYLKTSLSELSTRTQQSFNVFLTIIIVASIIALWLSKIISFKLISPLRALGETARNVAKIDDYSLRAEKINHDEIGSVVDSFNHMLNVIEHEHERLRESEEKFRLISASSKVGIFQLNPQGECIFANDEMSYITGLPITQILNESWLSVVEPEDRASLQAQLNTMMNTHIPININCCISDTNNKWINGHVGVLRGNNDEIIGYLGSINDVTEIRQAQSQLEHMAFYDTLTGLANRRLFRNRLEHLLNNISRNQYSLGLILLDLDHFKEINDSMGHDAGDDLLTIISERLQQCVRSSDTVARLGGDEFAIILPIDNDGIALPNIAEKIITAITAPIILQENELTISASLGIAVAPIDSSQAEELIKQADMALYKAKDMGRNNYQFFTDEINQKLVSHLDLVRDLRLAIDNQEFHLVFQPQLSLEDYKITGFEALIRWTCPNRGFVPPDQFINTAEDTGLIIPIGRLVISKACEQLKALIDKNLVDHEVVMTVNISAKQFQDDSLVDHITNELSRNNISPHQFEIELTESLLMENIDEALVKLNEIKALGILISIDDFGTGYSSLGYLKQLPVNILKVDRSFVSDIPENNDDMEITAAVIAMAHKLNYQVVAEGVETQEQLAFLRNCKCDFGQGYLFSKPLIADDLFEFCKSYKASDSRQQYS
ncbi:EAL domain-containing protein [Dasania marina]|uniref:EAL domain-containing protein n=1 Tax=Dasania marina TaxID=471499 RepID=UPI0030DD16D1|tara:strand:- start:12591 stop:15026 length:2436 start_codon:yes stop_codon:yes gene_type:complete